MYSKYLKKNFFLKLYPAPKIIGGRIKVKKTSASKPKDFAKLAYITILFIRLFYFIIRTYIWVDIVHEESC